MLPNRNIDFDMGREVNPYAPPQCGECRADPAPLGWSEWPPLLILLVVALAWPIVGLYDMKGYRPSFLYCLSYLVVCAFWSLDLWLLASFLRDLIPRFFP